MDMQQAEALIEKLKGYRNLTLVEHELIQLCIAQQKTISELTNLAHVH